MSEGSFKIWKPLEVPWPLEDGECPQVPIREVESGLAHLLAELVLCIMVRLYSKSVND